MDEAVREDKTEVAKATPPMVHKNRKRRKEVVKKKSVILKIKEMGLRDRNIRKELDAKKDKVKLVKKWGSRWVTLKDLRNSRLQWLLVQVTEKHEEEGQGEVDLGETIDRRLLLEDNGGSGSYDF